MIFIIGKFHHTYCDIVKPDEGVAKLPISINVGSRPVVTLHIVLQFCEFCNALKYSLINRYIADVWLGKEVVATDELPPQCYGGWD